jgi:hypothetical protein
MEMTMQYTTARRFNPAVTAAALALASFCDETPVLMARMDDLQ